MNLRIQKLLRLHRLHKPAGENGELDGGASGDGSTAGGSAAGGKSGDEGDAGGTGGAGGDGGEGGTGASGASGSGEGEGAAKPKMSDADAKLLRDVMKQKQRAQELERELEKARSAAAQFEGLDPAKVRDLLKKEEEAELKAAEARGEYDRLVKQMGERHTQEKTSLESRLEDAARSNQALAQQIAELTVGQSFSSSSFVDKEMTLTPTKARVIYGPHFEFKDGKVVGYDKPAGASERTLLVDSAGEALPFEQALRALVDKDPERDHMLRTSAKSGASSSTSSSTKSSRKAVDDAAAKATSNLRGADKIAAGLKALMDKK